MLYGILQIFKSKNKLKESVSVKLETCRIFSAFWNIMGLIKNYNAVLIIERVVWSHRLIQHVVVGHQYQVSS